MPRVIRDLTFCPYYKSRCSGYGERKIAGVRQVCRNWLACTEDVKKREKYNAQNNPRRNPHVPGNGA